MKWSRSQFFRLPDVEKEDWLAYDHLLRGKRFDMLRSMRALIEDGKSVDGGAYASVWLSLLEG